MQAQSGFKPARLVWWGVGVLGVLLLALGALAAPASARPAATCTWLTGSGNWSTKEMWSCGAVPGPGDTAIINNDTVTVSGTTPINDLQLNGGTITGSAPLIITGTMDWTGGTLSGTGATVISPGALLNIDSTSVVTLRGGRTLLNNGVVNWWGGLITSGLDESSTFQNNGHFNIFFGSATMDNAGGTGSRVINNSGEMHCVVTGTTAIEWDIHNTGLLNVRNITLQLGGAFTQTGLDADTLLGGGDLQSTQPLNFQGGELKGSGAIHGDVNNSGAALDPGPLPDGLAIHGSYTQGAGGSLTLEIGGLVAGTDYDRINVTGSLALGGALTVDLVGFILDFEPVIGDSFTILTGSPCSGTFSDTSLQFLPSGRKWNIVYGPTSIILQVVAANDKPNRLYLPAIRK